MLNRRTFLIAAGGLCLAAACGRSGSALQRARGDGVLRVGISGEEPFGYADSGGAVTGAQPEVARAALATIGIGGLEAVQVTFDKLIPGLLSEQYDMITAGMTITPSRCAQVAFSRPDFVAPPAFLVPEGNPRGIATFGGVARSGQRLGVIASSSEKDYALAAGVAGDRIAEYSGQTTLFRAVARGDVPVGALTALSLEGELRRNPGSGLVVTRPVDPVVNGRTITPASAFALRPQDADLLAAFDGALGELHASGDWLRVTSPFGFTADNEPPPALTTAAACSA
jgi:polar amino acid transport system substrate-binding protein